MLATALVAQVCGGQVDRRLIVEHTQTHALVDQGELDSSMQRDSSPEVIAGCCPTVNNEYCGFWAPKLTRATFPGRKVRVVKLKCIDKQEYEDEEMRLQRCRPYVLDPSQPTPDLLYCR